MPLTASSSIAIGTRAPDFRLQGARGRSHVLADVSDAKAPLVAFPYPKDEAQAVARAQGIACTPGLPLFDTEQRLFHHGQLDDSRPKNVPPVTGADLRAATTLVLAGKPSPAGRKRAIVCTIKWRGGEEPSWFHAGAAAE